MKIAYHADTAIDAQLVADVLNGNDIFAQVRGAQMQGAVGEAAAMGNVKVWVHDEYIAQAKSLVEEWQQAGFVSEEDADLFKDDNESSQPESVHRITSSKEKALTVSFLLIVVLLALAAFLEI